eukprot:1071812-Pelagomonas_calceolata.AAC.7
MSRHRASVDRAYRALSGMRMAVCVLVDRPRGMQMALCVFSSLGLWHADVDCTSPLPGVSGMPSGRHALTRMRGMRLMQKQRGQPPGLQEAASAFPSAVPVVDAQAPHCSSAASFLGRARNSHQRLHFQASGTQALARDDTGILTGMTSSFSFPDTGTYP